LSYLRLSPLRSSPPFGLAILSFIAPILRRNLSACSFVGPSFILDMSISFLLFGSSQVLLSALFYGNNAEFSYVLCYVIKFFFGNGLLPKGNTDYPLL